MVSITAFPQLNEIESSMNPVQMLLVIIFWISLFIIVWAMVGYPLSIRFLGKVIGRDNTRDYSLLPTVTVMVVAHNEEKVIEKKLRNLLLIDYPREKIDFIVTSDASTDDTNQIVRRFAERHPEMKLRLHEAVEHKGKTNAQNEAQKLVMSEFLVMTDANAMLNPGCIKELMACFTSDKIAYVCGSLQYENTDENATAHSEGAYWSTDVATREIEGRIASITAGNGALYACRNSDYFDAEPIQCHDSVMPLRFAIEGRRSINCLQAIAYEKAGEVDHDEYIRKVRMFRSILEAPKNMLKVINPFKYGWFSYFYFGHRFCRYSLWWAHFLLLIASTLLYSFNTFYILMLYLQLLFLLLGAFQSFARIKSHVLVAIRYYTMTVVAQLVAVIRSINGTARPTWETADSTR